MLPPHRELTREAQIERMPAMAKAQVAPLHFRGQLRIGPQHFAHGFHPGGHSLHEVNGARRRAEMHTFGTRPLLNVAGIPRIGEKGH